MAQRVSCGSAITFPQRRALLPKEEQGGEARCRRLHSGKADKHEIGQRLKTQRELTTLAMMDRRLLGTRLVDYLVPTVIPTAKLRATGKPVWIMDWRLSRR